MRLLNFIQNILPGIDVIKALYLEMLLLDKGNTFVLLVCELSIKKGFLNSQISHEHTKPLIYSGNFKVSKRKTRN